MIYLVFHGRFDTFTRGIVYARTIFLYFHAAVQITMMTSLPAPRYHSNNASLDLFDVLDVNVAPERSRNESA